MSNRSKGSNLKGNIFTS